MSKDSWVECPFNEATHVDINGKVTEIQYRAPMPENDIMMDFEGCELVLSKDATKALGIKCVKWVEESVIDMVLRWAWRDSKGRIELIFELPFGTDEKFIDTIKGDKFRLIEVIDGE